MASIHETAYPRIKSDPSARDLVEVYTPTPEELQFAEQYTREPLPRLVLLVHLKVFQRLGYFLPIRDTPSPILRHIAQLLGIEELPADLDRFDGSRTRKRQIKLIREYLGVTAIGDDTWALVRRTALEAAVTKDEVADIINIILEKLTGERFELPAFNTIAREARTARAAVNRQCFETVNELLNNEAKSAIDELLSTDATGPRSVWDAVKQEPT